MFLLTSAFALSLLGLFANAQPIDHTALGINTIEAHFEISDHVFESSTFCLLSTPPPS
jgi:hypothetical protein